MKIMIKLIVLSFLCNFSIVFAKAPTSEQGPGLLETEAVRQLSSKSGPGNGDDSVEGLGKIQFLDVTETLKVFIRIEQMPTSLSVWEVELSGLPNVSTKSNFKCERKFAVKMRDDLLRIFQNSREIKLAHTQRPSTGQNHLRGWFLVDGEPLYQKITVKDLEHCFSAGRSVSAQYWPKN